MTGAQPPGAAADRTSSPRMVFVGTGGGAHPGRYHASVALQPDAGRVLLLDTSGGFEVVAGLLRAGIDLGAVSRVFLSHRHSDHLFGLEPLLLHIGLQAMRGQCAVGEVRVMGHPAVLDAARAILDLVASHALQFIAGAGGQVRWQPVVPGESVSLWPDVDLTPVAVDHLPEDGTNLGCAVDFRGAGSAGGAPYRVVYSGDTRPVDALRRAASGAQVLIHECGGLDAARDLVYRAGHSTAGEVGRLGRETGVGRLFLFHLPSDGAAPGLQAEAQAALGGRVAVPEDGDAYPLFWEPGRDAPVPAAATGAGASPPAPPPGS